VSNIYTVRTYKTLFACSAVSKIVYKSQLNEKSHASVEEKSGFYLFFNSETCSTFSTAYTIYQLLKFTCGLFFY